MQPLGVLVEPADRVEARAAGRASGGTRSSTVRRRVPVADGRGHAGGLVEREVDVATRRARDRRAVDLDAWRAGIDAARPSDRGPAVDRHAAGGDQLVGAAPRATPAAARTFWRSARAARVRARRRPAASTSSGRAAPSATAVVAVPRPAAPRRRRRAAAGRRARSGRTARGTRSRCRTGSAGPAPRSGPARRSGGGGGARGPCSRSRRRGCARSPPA